MKIGSVDTSKEVLVIAEIGNNHEGDVELAKDMIHAAAETGVQAVKFQTFKTELFQSRELIERFNKLKSFELSQETFACLAQEAEKCGLMFLSTPLDLLSADFLAPLMPAFKIASSDNDFYQLLEKVAATGKPIILSSGMLAMDEVCHSADFIRRIWEKSGISGELAVLHCVTSYPVPLEQANLNAIPELSKTLDATVGYSDHTLGIEASVLSVALGARIVEKHFTLNKNQSDFRDHQLSADPADMKLLVERIRQVPLLLGDGNKVKQPVEHQIEEALRRSIAFGRDLTEGHVVASEDLIYIRPGTGIPVSRDGDYIGKKLCRDVSAGSFLQDSCF